MESAGGDAIALIPEVVDQIVVFVRNISLIAIPFVLWIASQRMERRRATMDVIRTIDHDIDENLQRLFLFRRHEESVGKGDNPASPSPYKNDPALFFFDSVKVLNLYEAVCVEIDKETVDRDLLYTGIRNTIIGAHEIVLARYSDKVGSDQSHAFPYLVGTAIAWRRRAALYGQLGPTRIPA